jgi:hypothetical protein
MTSTGIKPAIFVPVVIPSSIYATAWLVIAIATDTKGRLYALFWNVLNLREAYSLVRSFIREFMHQSFVRAVQFVCFVAVECFVKSGAYWIFFHLLIHTVLLHIKLIEYRAN